MESNNYLELLQTQYGFSMPNLPLDKVGNVEVREEFQNLKLYIDDTSWMGLHSKDYREVYEFYSQFTLAKGNVLCSGMGLLLRESWLLTKGVKITLVEVNQNLIWYHRKHNPNLCNRINIIHNDIRNQTGKYDVVLLDHYEHEEEEWIINDVRSIMENVECDVLWFWPLERICKENGGWTYYCWLRKQIPKLPDLDESTFNVFLDHYYYYRKFR